MCSSDLQESADAKAARERAEAAAEKTQIGEVRQGVTAETAAILRRFGIKAAMAGSPGAASFASGGLGGGPGSTGNPGSVSVPGFSGGGGGGTGGPGGRSGRPGGVQQY